MAVTNENRSGLDTLSATNFAQEDWERGALPDGAFPLLLAIDRDGAADAAIAVTRTLSDRCSAVPTVVHVFELPPTPSTTTGDEVLARRRDELQATVSALGGLPTVFPLDVELGDAADAILDEAARIHAELVVIGVHQPHGAATADGVERDTARRVISNATTPVLAVHPSLRALPQTIVVAMDFSPASLRAVRLVRRIVAPTATIHLAYVGTVTGEAETAGVRSALRHLVSMLHPTRALRIHPTILTGDPATALRALIERTRADLVALGTREHPPGPSGVGVVAERLIELPPVSVLAAPPRMGAKYSAIRTSPS